MSWKHRGDTQRANFPNTSLKKLGVSWISMWCRSDLRPRSLRISPLWCPRQELVWSREVQTKRRATFAVPLRWPFWELWVLPNRREEVLGCPTQQPQAPEGRSNLLLKLNKIKTSVLKSQEPPFQCSTATKSWWLPCWAAQIWNMCTIAEGSPGQHWVSVLLSLLQTLLAMSQGHKHIHLPDEYVFSCLKKYILMAM